MFLTDQLFLFLHLNTQVVNLVYVAFAVLVITVITLADLVLTLYPNIRKRAAVPVPAQSTGSQS